MNGFELVAAILKREGVEWLACFPSNPLIEACAKVGIRPIAFRHERGAVMAADGFSRVSDRKRFGVVAVQAQAGAENALGGIAQAYADNVPMLVLPGGNNLDRLGVRPNYVAERNFASLCRRAETVFTSEQIVDVMRRAFHALRNGPGGPVLVELTTDVCNATVADVLGRYRMPQAIRQAPSAGDVKAAANALVAAKRPLLWAGAGVLMAEATAQLKELAELLAAPVFCTMPGKSAFDERHPLSLGAGSGATTLPAHTWLKSADVMLALGSSLTRTPYGQSVPSGATLIQNTDNIDEFNKDEDVDIGLYGDTALTLEALLEEIKALCGDKPQDASAVKAEIATLREQWLSDWRALLYSDDAPMTYYRVIHELNQNLDLENSIVTHDAGAPRDSIVPFFTATTPHSYIGWGKTTHLGFGIPLMVGAKMAAPEKFCLNLMGDGAFGMSGTDVETAGRAGAPITTVLLNNGGMATYPGGFPTARASYGVSHMRGDYAMIAEGMGARGLKVEQPSQMGPALKQAQQLNADGTSVLIDVAADMGEHRSKF
jgi:thiamine pyrophosphate-dependent acetolactate synthase large subunit-like protein